MAMNPLIVAEVAGAVIAIAVFLRGAYCLLVIGVAAYDEIKKKD
ncbi:hypothetical protein ATOP_08520 [Granulimonas faecalis]|uniref:Uncharacterized protein n=1 Tax=Granulimonas faecalis TaxID=2894155 RepID=A0AAV5B1S9_9ACTN|nr:hypothetical protein ATOP_08520 [Granulimonas faecalis]